MRVNSGATDAQLEWKRQGELVQRKGHAREDLEAYETAYNAACGSIARGELGKGEFLLNAAKGGFFVSRFSVGKEVDRVTRALRFYGRVVGRGEDG